MVFSKTLYVAILSSGLFLFQTALQRPAWAEDDATANPEPAAAVSAVPSSGATYAPMTQTEQVHHYIAGTFSIEAAVRAAVGAAILQGTNTPTEWGLGVEGYARRFANDYAQHITRQTILFGAGDILGEDNRYFASGLTGTGPRMRYAVESEFLARRPDGHRRLSYSRLAAVVGTAFISREWQPRSTDHVHNALVATGTVFGTEIGFNIAREFLPRIFHPHPAPQQ